MTDNANQTNAAPLQGGAPLQTETQVAPGAPDISAEAGMGWGDWAVMAAVAAAALWYLYKEFWANRGACGGCAKGKGGCAVQRSTRGAGQAGVQVPIDRIGRGGR